MKSTPVDQPGIDDYALIGDCHGVALVSRTGAIDWCCMPRPDSPSCFGALVGPGTAGTCAITPTGEFEVTRRYLPDTMVLETVFESASGSVRLTDCMAAGEDYDGAPTLLRVASCLSGSATVRVLVQPRFEYGALSPWLREHGKGSYTAIGASTGLVIRCTHHLSLDAEDGLSTDLEMRAGDDVSLTIAFSPPQLLDEGPGEIGDVQTDEAVETTKRWWQEWIGNEGAAIRDAALNRSALVLKTLSYRPTGALIAAPTTSLPEEAGGSRNWDYRYSWIRDSAFAIRALGQLGIYQEAREFRDFVQRSAAGMADRLQPMYGVGGEIRLPEVTLEDLAGYRGSRPVRIGNAAVPQRQLDLYGYMLDLSYRWHQRGEHPSDSYWRFLADCVDMACRLWTQTDRGIWEVRGTPVHFVHSKVMCWSAVDCGIRLAEELDLQAPLEEWRKTRFSIRQAVEDRGYDSKRGVFVRAFDSEDLDASLLLLPWVGFVDFTDPRMIRTADAIMSELGRGRLVKRYVSEDGLEGTEGSFVACTFWLAECLARQGRSREARQAFDAAISTSNDLGLFAEEYDTEAATPLGNFPQAMSHFSHITARVALDAAQSADRSPD
jgi:GH15 family glucan-1,4-alpha-glucosidase